MKATSISIERDANGNKVARFNSVSRRGFSVQTNGNLPLLHGHNVGDKIPAHSQVHLWEEFLAYVKEYGTERQQSLFTF